MTGERCDVLALEMDALECLMPMYMALDAVGRIISLGSTLQKILPKSVRQGAFFFDLFTVRRPGRVHSMAQLCPGKGQKVAVALSERGHASFRGAVVPLAGGGVLLNLSFGAGVLEAVRRYALTEADFAPTDLAMEMLYLVEVKSVLTEDLRQKNARLEGEKTQAKAEAQTDPLTGLYNRRALDQALDQFIATQTPFALMHLDLDFFKSVNDTLGHAAGDYVLREVAAALRREMRESDIVARVGGDEFVTVLPGLVAVAKLRAVAQRIIGQILRPMVYEGRPCTVSASIGMTVSNHYTSPKAAEMLADADMALYAAKRAGRGRARMFQSLIPKPA
ncbi:GGDEF domain-containing protein [Neogemmobacter tilapiae]|uniref:GGDEF domain-containing protein n=1 Tax=Neogemmobacter tilapiae TaxID=875041 RepID=A0A918TQ28_9RHOB|nr:GGDEF domain-containing protein [Gemmobacter tilapiae]GHC54566.1 GGDEF domain-containing protein [Gemmobacter tilapiae]